MGIRQENFNISVGTSIIQVFERIDITNHHIFSEFIDNAYQSFRDHKKQMVEEIHVKKCEIKITWTNDEVIVEDNAFGMDRDGFERALRLNDPAKNYAKDSLSKYGMGLKYAAANLGDEWTIESTAYGSSEKFSGTIDIGEWKKSNPETMPVQITDDFDKFKHFTTITIRKLKHRYNDAEMKKVLKKLSIIYQHFIDKEKDLEITINGEKVQYSEPDIYRDKNGSDVMEFLNKKFFYQGKQFEFTGWIGVLNKASTGEAGFSLVQNNRAIKLYYRPKEIFGASNSYTYQRIVGSISFIGDSWQVRVNKDGLAWEGTGLEERFLDELKGMEEVKRIQKAANERRVRENPNRKISLQSKNANVDGLKNQYAIDEKVCFTVTPSTGFSIRSVKVNQTELSSTGNNSFEFVVTPEMPNTIVLKVSCGESKGENPPVTVVAGGGVSIPPQNTIKKTLTKKEKIEKTFTGLRFTKIPGQNVIENPNLCKEGVIVEYENTKYSFVVEEILDSSVDSWYELKEMPKPNENSYKITINHMAGFLKNVFLSDDTKIAFVNICISLALAEITGTASGLNRENSRILISKLNDVINKSGK